VDKSLSPGDLEQVREQLGQKGVKQIERMVRQRTRQERVEELIRTDEGLEPISGIPMRLVDTNGDYADYFHIVRMICDRLSKEPLYLVGTTNQAIERSKMTGIVHQFLHMRNPERRCMLARNDNIDGANQELTDISKLSGVIDLVDANLRSGWSRSVFDWPMDEEMIFKLAFGDYRLFLFIDYERLFQMATKEKGITLEWVSSDLKGVKGDSRDFLVKHSDIIVGSPDARGAWARRGSHSKVLLMSGFFNRIFVELMTPEYWLDLLEKTVNRTAHELHERPQDEANLPNRI
jgi:hypothetical protein